MTSSLKRGLIGDGSGASTYIRERERALCCISVVHKRGTCRGTWIKVLQHVRFETHPRIGFSDTNRPLHKYFYYFHDFSQDFLIRVVKS